MVSFQAKEHSIKVAAGKGAVLCTAVGKGWGSCAAGAMEGFGWRCGLHNQCLRRLYHEPHTSCSLPYREALAGQRSMGIDNASRHLCSASADVAAAGSLLGLVPITCPLPQYFPRKCIA